VQVISHAGHPQQCEQRAAFEALLDAVVAHCQH